MMNVSNYEIIVIGGSWGGLNASVEILKDLPVDFPIPIVLLLHRLKGQKSFLTEIIQSKVKLKVKDVEEKEEIQAGTIYIAPPDYHVLVESDFTFSLDVSELIHYSRPSIDVTFEAVAQVYRNKAIGIILTGANQDGSAGLAELVNAGSLGIVQSIEEAESKEMPAAAIRNVKPVEVLKLKEINGLLNDLCTTLPIK